MAGIGDQLGLSAVRTGAGRADAGEKASELSFLYVGSLCVEMHRYPVPSTLTGDVI